jgi:FHS family L-fucose permease-like MFS transporter
LSSCSHISHEQVPRIQEEEKSKGSLAAALKHKHLTWAVVAQFFYVGAQVCVTSFFVRAAMTGGGLDEKTAGYYLGAYGILFMAGRFTGTLFMKFIKPAKLLAIYAVACILLSAAAIYADGKNVVLSRRTWLSCPSYSYSTRYSGYAENASRHLL